MFRIFKRKLRIKQAPHACRNNKTSLIHTGIGTVGNTIVSEREPETRAGGPSKARNSPSDTFLDIYSDETQTVETSVLETFLSV